MLADLVRKARSFRRFVENDRIPESVLRDLVDLARITPCGGNQQPLRYRIVSSVEETNAVFPLLVWASYLEDWKGPAEGERPTGYLVLAVYKKATGVTPQVDAGIAAQTIQLAATEAGFGACILGSVRRDDLKKVLGLGDTIDVLYVIALGKPAETVELETLDESKSLPGAAHKYWRDEASVHHVPKRSLDDVLL